MTKNNIISLQAGAASVDITPEDPHFLYGYPYVERISTGVHDPLLSSALYISDGKVQAIFISNDLIYISKASVARIRKIVSEKTAVQTSNIMIAATHTHSGPVTVDCINSSDDSVVPKADGHYLKYMEDKTIDVACLAYKNASPAEIGFVVADGTGIGTNRHHVNGPSDLDIPTLIIREINKGRFIACMLVCNMHPTVLHENSTLYSGDFPACARTFLQREYLGVECPVLYFTGAAGNQSPRHVTKSNTFEEAQRLGEIIGKAIGSKIKTGIHYFSEASVLTFQDFVDLPKRQFPSVEQATLNQEKALGLLTRLRNTSKDPREIRTAEVDWFGANELLNLSKLTDTKSFREVYDSCLPAEIQIIKIALWTFVAWPGEIFIEYELELKRKDENIFLITAANGDLQGYISTEEADKSGYYEASNSIFHHSSGKILIDATFNLLKTSGKSLRS